MQPRQVGWLTPVFLLQAHVDNARSRLHLLRQLSRHAGRKNDDERRVLIYGCRLSGRHFAHRDAVVFKHLRECPRAVASRVADAHGGIVETSLRQECDADKGHYDERENHDRRTRGARPFTRRGGNDANLRGFHQWSWAFRQASNRAGVSLLNASTSWR